jgi:hypothetical protein
MGVLSCARMDCSSVMCRRYSSTHGYICSECFQELCAGGLQDVASFLTSPKPPPEAARAVEAHFAALFPDKDSMDE